MNDLRYALRQLGKSPGFTFTAVLTLALGMAATASMFTVVHGLLFEPLPYPAPEQLVQVWSKENTQFFDYMPLTTGGFYDLQERARSFTALGVFSPRRFNLGGERADAVEGAACSPGLFAALQIPPLHGRCFDAGDEADGATAVVILSHALWQQRFGGDPRCIGRSLRLDGRDFTIVGVMPERFEVLSSWTRHRPLALWTLLSLRGDARNHGNAWLASIARLKSDVTLAQASGDVRRVAEDVRQAVPGLNPRQTFWLMPLGREVGGIPALRVSVLLAAGWGLLALAAQNVAGMMLARGVSRQSEIAMRFALGATRWRIIRQSLVESFVLAVLAAGGGLVLTLWCVDALAAHLPAEVMPRGGLAVNRTSFRCVLMLIGIVTQMVGLTPALLAAKTDVIGGLKETGAGSAGRRTQRRLRAIVIGQIAIALMLVSVALQLTVTYRGALASSRPLRSEEILTAAVSVRGPHYDDTARLALCDRLLERISALPGVRDAGFTSQLPFNGGITSTILIDDQPFDLAQPLQWVQSTQVTAGFFPAMGATAVRGRVLAPDDEWTKNRVIVINQAMARRYWPGHDPIGHRVGPARAGGGPENVVVGVIPDLAQSPEQPARPEMYFPFIAGREDLFLVVRMVPGVRAPVAAIRAELQRLDPDLGFAQIRTMAAHFDDQTQVFVVITSLVDGLTVAILGLAALGVYGTLSFHFTHRRREIGVRVALGASATDVVALVLRQALIWVGAGAVAGATLAWLWGRAMSRVLENASPYQTLSVGLSIALVVLVALAGAWLPARRATRVNPVDTLRAE